MIRAPAEDEQVAAIRKRLSGFTPETITVYDRDETLRRLPVESIICIAVNGKQLNIVTEKDCYTVRQTLRDLEKMLEGRKFVRISRYEIVNLEKVERFDFTFAGTLRLELAGGMETWASRRSIPLIRKRLLEKE